jgi:thiamine-phosphate pyrophosphorylase
MRLVMPRLYVILDAGFLTGSIEDTTQKLIEAGVLALQYRNKKGPARDALADACKVAAMVLSRGASLFVNDRPDIACLSGASGVHVGQDDLGVAQARAMIGATGWVGVSTHNEAQFRAAVETSADYIAVGPVFGTRTKENPDPVVGTELIRRVRALTNKPIVAIGGVTMERAVEVIEAGADSVAVISDILRAEDPTQRAKDFVRRLEAVKPTVNH